MFEMKLGSPIAVKFPRSFYGEFLDSVLNENQLFWAKNETRLSLHPTAVLMQTRGFEIEAEIMKNTKKLVARTAGADGLLNRSGKLHSVTGFSLFVLSRLMKLPDFFLILVSFTVMQWKYGCCCCCLLDPN